MGFLVGFDSSIHDGVEGTDVGSTWNLTLECVILVGVLLVRKTIHMSLSYKESHFFELSPVSLSSCSVKKLVAHPVGVMVSLSVDSRKTPEAD